MNIKELQLYLLSNYPFYYGLLQQAKITQDDKTKYPAAVKISTKLEIIINPTIFGEYTVAEQAGFLVHELQHVYKDHIKQTQMKQIEAISEKIGIEPNHMLANISMDMEINPGISELYNSPTLGVKAPKSPDKPQIIMPEMFKFNKGDSWINYYAKLKEKAKNNPQGGKSKKGQPGDQEAQGSGTGDPTPHQDHDYFLESTKDEKMFDEIAANAAKRAKQISPPGTTPREIEKFLLEYEASKQVPWYLVLRQFMQSLVDVKTRNTWKKVNRRFRGKLPGAKKLPRMDLLIGIDSSGSVSDENLKAFYAEVDAINDTGMCTIDIAVFDTNIHQREEYKRGFEAQRLCAGGTSFVPVHKLALEERYKGVIYLTDGWADFPDANEVSYKCLWVLNTDVKPPYGNVVRIK